MAEYWEELGQYNMGIITDHVCKVVKCTFKDPNFTKLTEEEQNIMKWAALLHDIYKKGYPLFEGKDHIHPFMSAA